MSARNMYVVLTLCASTPMALIRAPVKLDFAQKITR